MPRQSHASRTALSEGRIEYTTRERAPRRLTSTRTAEHEEQITYPLLSQLVPNRFGQAVNLVTSSDDLDCLKRSIQENGIQTPLVVWKTPEGLVVISGMNRYRIARQLKMEQVPVIIRHFTSVTDAKLFAMSDNLARRHLTTAQKALLALEYQKLITVGQGRRSDLTPSSSMTKVDSHSIAAQWAGVSTGSMANLRTVLASNDVTLLGDVLSGKVKIAAAARYVRGQQRRPNVSSLTRMTEELSGPIYSCIEGDSSDLIANIAAMYLKPGVVVADVTYGRGVFWRKVDLTQVQLMPTDLLTLSSSVDFRALPYTNASVDIVVLDPPFQHDASTPLTGSCYEARAVCRSLSHDKIIELYALGMKEAVRVLKRRGVLWVKCGDEIASGKPHWSHIEVYTRALDLGFRALDLFILKRSSLPPIQSLPQRHARKNHSFMWVFLKE